MKVALTLLFALIALAGFGAPVAAQTLSSGVCTQATTCLTTVAPVAGATTFGPNYRTTVPYSGTLANPIVAGFAHELDVTGTSAAVTGGDLLSGYFYTNYVHTGFTIPSSNVLEASSYLLSNGSIGANHAFFNNLLISGGGTITSYAAFTAGITGNNGTISDYSVFRCGGGDAGTVPTNFHCLYNADSTKDIYTAGKLNVGAPTLNAMVDVVAPNNFNGLRIWNSTLAGTQAWALRPVTNANTTSTDLFMFEYGPNQNEFGYQSGGGFEMNKRTASGAAPGAGWLKMEVVMGTNAGSCKIVAYAGTSTTPVTIIDNVGSGC